MILLVQYLGKIVIRESEAEELLLIPWLINAKIMNKLEELTILQLIDSNFTTAKNVQINLKVKAFQSKEILKFQLAALDSKTTCT